MIDGRSRVTVVGTSKGVDVALPTSAPIGEYSAGLANLCGLELRGSSPPAWSLAVAGAAPFPLSASLAGSGVVDGQVLYLRELTRDPGSDPSFADIDELVADEAGAQRRQSWPRSLVVLAFGLVWLTAAAGFTLAWAGTALIAAAGVTAGAALLMLGTGWALAQRRVLAPVALCVLTALTAVPCLAISGALLGKALVGPGMEWIGAIAGAGAGVLMSLAATPEAVVVLIAMQFGVALVLAPLMVAIHATGPQVAAATVVAMMSVIGLSKTAAAMVTVWSQRDPAPATAASVTALLIRSRRLLTVLVAGPTIALAVALPVLAFSGNGFGLAMAAVAGVALIVRAQQAGFTDELVPIGGAGLVGLFATAAALVQQLSHHRGVVLDALILVGVGLALVAAGTIGAVMRHGADPAPDMPAGFPAGAGRPDRRKVVDILGVLCVIATTSLALGVFGVFGQLMETGRGIVGG